MGMGSTGLSLPLLRVLRGEKGTSASVTSPDVRKSVVYSLSFSLSLPTVLYKSLGDSLLSRRQVL